MSNGGHAPKGAVRRWVASLAPTTHSARSRSDQYPIRNALEWTTTLSLVPLSAAHRGHDDELVSTDSNMSRSRSPTASFGACGPCSSTRSPRLDEARGSCWTSDRRSDGGLAPTTATIAQRIQRGDDTELPRERSQATRSWLFDAQWRARPMNRRLRSLAPAGPVAMLERR